MIRGISYCAIVAVILAGWVGSAAGDSVGIVNANGRVDVSIDDKAVLSYQYGSVPYKPYVKQLRSPEGVGILLDAPSDHLHHHALMYAVTVDGVNFWEEATAPGKQEHVSLENVTSRANDRGVRAGFDESLKWVNPRTGDCLLNEKREIRLYRPVGGDGTFLTWRSVLSVPEGKESAVLTGAHYHGLGMRFVRSMDKDGRFFNADNVEGTVFRGSERLLRSRWCAYTAKAEGKDVTVAMFDDPNNVRHPATWFVMDDPFAYMSATQNLHVEPLKIEADKPLDLRYAVALWDGQVEPEHVEQAYRRWVRFRPGPVTGLSVLEHAPSRLINRIGWGSYAKTWRGNVRE